MAGYFSLVGKIVTEKGSWYKILFFAFVAVLANLFQPKILLAQAYSEGAGFNLSGWLTLFLASLISSGFVVQVYSHRIKADSTVFPEFDIGKMIVHAFKIIPLNLIWGIYFLIYMMLLSLIIFACMQTPSNAPWVVGIVFGLPFVLVGTLAYPVLYAAHTKSFKYSGFFNPIAIFHVLMNTGLPMFLNCICYLLSLLVLFLFVYLIFVIFGASILAGGADVATAAIPVLIGGILFVCLLAYFFYVFQFAFVARTCDIAKEFLAYSELMDSDFDYSDEEKQPQLSDEELFGGYMRNKPEEDDIQY